MVIGEGHTLEAYKRVSLCQQQQTQANQSDDELEYAAENTSRGVHVSEAPMCNSALVPLPQRMSNTNISVHLTNLISLPACYVSEHGKHGLRQTQKEF